jgi:SAM-dependent methyltransferase
MFEPVTQALVGDALIGPGCTVLDVATGPGEPALAMVAVVGPAGKVFGTDPIPEMVAAARRATERAGIGNAQFEVAFADRLPYADDSFDAVVSRFGVMFFPSPAEGVREMRRVVRPGGKLALAVWHSADRNPFFSALQQVIDRYIDSPAAAPDAPGAFRFAKPGALLHLLREAGVGDASERLFRFRIEAALSAEEFLDLRFGMSDTLREKAAMLSSEQANDMRQQPLEALRQYSTGGGMNFPAEVIIVSGHRGDKNEC